MPHLDHTVEELDELYPSLVPPQDDGLQDVDGDEPDGVFQHGLKLAARIREVTQFEGRRKRPLQSPLAAKPDVAQGTLALCAAATQFAPNGPGPTAAVSNARPPGPVEDMEEPVSIPPARSPGPVEDMAGPASTPSSVPGGDTGRP